MKTTLNKIIRNHIKESFFPGAVCLASKDGRIIYQNSEGHRFINKTLKYDMNIDTVFDIASITKMYITTIILMLISKNKLDLNVQLQECLPRVKEYNTLEKKISSITIKQLLTHSSELIEWFPFYTIRNHDFYKSLDKLLKNTPKSSIPTYSDLNFMLLGEVIKEITKKSLDLAVHNYIVSPLKMKTVTYGPISIENVAATECGNQIESKMCLERGVSFRNWRSTKEPIIGEVNDGNCHYYFNGISGHAGLFASAKDVMKLGELYLQGGEWGNKQLINNDLIKKSFVEHVPTRGLGWEHSKVFPQGIGHTGFTGTSIWINLKKNLVVVTLTNRLHLPSPISIQQFRSILHHKILEHL